MAKKKVGRLILYDFWTTHIHQYVHIVIITIAWANVVVNGWWILIRSLLTLFSHNERLRKSDKTVKKLMKQKTTRRVREHRNTFNLNKGLLGYSHEPYFISNIINVTFMMYKKWMTPTQFYMFYVIISIRFLS